MVTSVSGNSLAALQARDNALANRPSQAQQAEAPAPAGRGQAVVYAGSSGAPTLSAILSVQDSLNRAAAIADVGANAGQTIADLLTMARDKAAQAAAGAGQPEGLDGDFQQLLKTIDQIAGSAAFQGVRMLAGGEEGALQFKADLTGEASVSVAVQDFTAGGPTLGLGGASLLGSSDEVAGVLDRLDAAREAVSAQLAQMKGQSEQIQAHLAAIGRLQNALNAQAPADLDADGARLQALQIQQALAGQGASLANQAPQAVLSLFRSQA